MLCQPITMFIYCLHKNNTHCYQHPQHSIDEAQSYIGHSSICPRQTHALHTHHLANQKQALCCVNQSEASITHI